MVIAFFYSRSNQQEKSMSRKITESALAVATSLAAIAATGIFNAGCASNKPAAPKPAKLTILSDRECIPPPYASPSQLAVGRRSAGTAEQPPVGDTDTFIPAPPADDNSFTAFNQGEAPIFTPAQNAPAVDTPPAPASNVQGAKAQPPKAQPKASSKPARTYKVKKGDYLSVIAYMYKVSTQDLAAANNMEINALLREGRVLVLPENAAETPRPRPAIKKKPNMKAVEKPYQAKKDTAAKADEKDVHIVKENENFWTIVRNNKVKEADVRALNPQIKDFSKLRVGDRIRLRASSGAKAVTAKTEPVVDAVPIAPVAIDAQVQPEAPQANDAPVAPEPAPVAPVAPVEPAPAPEIAPTPAPQVETIPLTQPAIQQPITNPDPTTAE